MKRNTWAVLAGFILICLVVGGIAGAITAPSVDGWYASINKPSWNPPNRVFGPVWTVLYVMMAVAAWLVWRTVNNTRTAMILFFCQLALNFGWSVMFFGVKSPGLGLAEVILFWLVLLATTLVFFRTSKVAGALMLPYLAWVSFAAFLNFTIWRLN